MPYGAELGFGSRGLPSPPGGSAIPRQTGEVPHVAVVPDREKRAAADKEQAKPEMKSLANHINAAWQAALISKQVNRSGEVSVEERFLECLRQKNGQYDPQKLSKIQKGGGSEVFMMLTNVKCRAAESWIRDIMLPPGEKPWGLAPTPEPELPQASEVEIIQQVIRESAELMTEGGIDSVTEDQITDRMTEMMAEVHKEKLERAESAISRFEVKIEDELREGGFYAALSEFITDLCTYPTAFLKGPVVRKKPRLSWQENEEGEMQPVVVNKFIRQYKRVSGFDIYPSPNSKSIHDGYLLERHRLRRADLMAMKGVEGFSSKAIDEVMREFGTSGLRMWLYVDQERAEALDRPDYFNDPDPPIDCLEFWGSVQGTKLLEWGMSKKDIPDPWADYNIQAWLVDRWVIMARINPHPLGNRPYYAASFDMNNETIWGQSPPMLMRDIQKICNATVRAMINNLGIASGPQVEVYMNRIQPGEDVEDIYPWKIWKTQDGGQGNNPAVRFFQPDSMTQGLMSVYEYFFHQASEQSGIPAYIYGSAQICCAGKTASGLSMLMNAASKTLKGVISHIDEHVIRKLIKEHWIHVMLYDDDMMKSGDINVVARASEYLIIKEQLQLRLTEFLRETNNPVDLEIMKLRGRATLLREAVKLFNLPESIIPSEKDMKSAEEAMKQQQAQQAEMMGAEGEGAMGLPAGLQPPTPEGAAMQPGGARAGGEARMAA